MTTTSDQFGVTSSNRGQSRREPEPVVRFWSPGFARLLVPAVTALSTACGGGGPGDRAGAGGETGMMASTGGSSDPAGVGGHTNLGTGGGMGPNDGKVPNEGGESVDCATVQRPTTPLRRLTRLEYHNTVRELLGEGADPGEEFDLDEEADGFRNNALILSIDVQRATRYVLAAENLAAQAVAHLEDFLPCDPATAGEEACARQFAAEFGRRAYRRPLDEQELSLLMEAYALGGDFSEGIEVMMRLMFQSPNFLFRVEMGTGEQAGAGMVKLSPYELATRLSYLIWSSMPDETLFAAAEGGTLADATQIAEQARRMLSDPKARNGVLEFYRQWLELLGLEESYKDTNAFPLWSDETRQALFEEADAVIEAIVFGSDPSVGHLLGASLARPAGPLAELYGMPASTEVVEVSGAERAGVLTLPAFLAKMGHPDQTSPVLRGKFIRSKLLCQHVDPPPPGIMFNVGDPKDGGTARERFGAHLTSPSCEKCHSLMDPLGFPLESYDAMGAYRETDGGQQMDLSGEFLYTKGIDGAFEGAIEMAHTLAGADEVRDCLATEWYQYSVGRGLTEGDLCSIVPLQQAFAQAGGNLLELVVQLTQTEAFLYRPATSAVSP